MARKKTAEELMLEAELSAQKERGSQSDRGQTLSDAESRPVPDAAREVAAVAKRRVNPKAVAIVVAAIAVVAIAAFIVSRMVFSHSTDVWDGTADTSWYSAGMTSMNITPAEQLAGMRKLCNDGTSLEGIRFTLARNLDLYDIPTKPIGDGRNMGGTYNVFKGSFDGGGHTISGMNVQEDTWDHAGLFGSASGGDIQNLTVEGKGTGQVRVGGVVGEIDGGSLANCTNRCKVASTKTATSYYPVTADVGGVCGIWLGMARADVTSAKLENLTNEGDVSARACSAGGVVGTIANTDGFTLTVDNLVNDGAVTVYCETDERDEAVGGVVGVIGVHGTDIVSNLVNNGEVACSTVLSVGGVVGALMPYQRSAKEEPKGEYAEGIELRKLSNTARVGANAADERAHVGGIVGYLEDSAVVFEECENTGELAATNGNADDIAATNGAEVWDAWEDEHPKTW